MENVKRFRKILSGRPTPPAGKADMYLDSDGKLKVKFADGSIVTEPATQASANGATPAGTTSATLVMMGIAGSFKSDGTGRILLIVTGMIGNSTIGDGASVQLSYGTGTAPTNGAAVTGTQVGLLKNFVAATAAGKHGFACSAIVTGLTVGTTYWLDLALKAVTGGTATVYDVDIMAIEI